MIRPHLETRLLDIESQEDFFLPGGSCYGPRSSTARENVCRLFDWARLHHLPVLSTLLRVRTGEHGPLAAEPHCIDGTEGERKIPGTILPDRINLGLRNSTDLPAGVWENHQQVIFEKRHYDLFDHAGAERLISEMPPCRFVICGAGVAGGIAAAAVGLRSRGFEVVCATDAVLDLGHPLAEMAWRRMEAKGVIFCPTEEIVRPVRTCPSGKSRRPRPMRSASKPSPSRL
jgi:nicotinamidase-related amidase